MIIEAYDRVGSHRTGTLKNFTAKQIAEVLGFEANCQDDPDKVKYSWGFKADGVHCGIWDYKFSYTRKIFSLYGPREVFEQLFGAENIE